MKLKYFDNQIHKYNPLPHHKMGKQFTASGYGSKIPSPYMVKRNNRWYRIYIMIFSNSGTAYIISKGERLILKNETITTHSDNIEWEANL